LRPKEVEFAEIMYYREQSPLYIHFSFFAQGKSVHTFLSTDVRQTPAFDRLNQRDDYHQPPAIDLINFFAIISEIRLCGCLSD
jgi:hypothetical protein